MSADNTDMERIILTPQRDKIKWHNHITEHIHNIFIFTVDNDNSAKIKAKMISNY